MKKTLLISALLFVVTSASAQDAWIRPVVCRDGIVIGRLYEDIEPGVDYEGAYVVDTIYVLSHKIETHIPVFAYGIHGTPEEVSRFAPYWTPTVEKEESGRAILRFDSYRSGGSYYLEIKKTKTGLCATKAMMMWMSTQYYLNIGTDEEPDMITFPAVALLLKRIHNPINRVIIFDDYFDDVKKFECYYIPREHYDGIEHSLKLMEQKHKFRISDFERGKEAIIEFGLEDRELEQ